MLQGFVFDPCHVAEVVMRMDFTIQDKVNLFGKNSHIGSGLRFLNGIGVHLDERIQIVVVLTNIKGQGFLGNSPLPIPSTNGC